ncbi:MAG: ATP-binding protein [Melioribacteraceae bacterium]|nr:ATP-binding protein [Melioribacteraceae bacterium]
MKTFNPFNTTGYISPKYFCDRESETKRIIEAINNDRNLTLYSLRRIGKTGLIRHVFFKLKKEYELFYLDIHSTSNLAEFVNVLGDSVIGKLDTTSSKFIKIIKEIFSSLKPTISFDPLTENTSVQLSIESSAEAKQSLNKIIEYIESSGKKVVIAIDEFQQIASYPEKNIEELLRSYMQKTKNISYLFAGSSKRLIISMFTDKKRPFYQSTELMYLTKIDRKKYSKFISRKYSENGKNISSESIEFILDWTKSHTFFVQYICNKLFASGVDNIDTKLVKQTMYNVLLENGDSYNQIKMLLPKNQWNLLKAISLEDGIEQIAAQSFIKKHNLSSPSSVTLALKALLQKELVTFIDEKYQLENVFLQRWIEREFKL